MTKQINGKNLCNIHNAHYNCYSLTGSPECGPNVTDMSNAYYNCTNLTGCPMVGPSAVNMSGAYYNCYSLTGSPLCPANVTDMTNAYYNCTNLIGYVKCGNNVTSMAGTYYNCQNLTGSPTVGPMVENIYSTFYNCKNLSGIASLYSTNITNATNAFYGRSNDKPLYILALNDSSTINTLRATSSSNSIIGADVSWSNGWSFSNDSRCYYNKTQSVNLYSGNNIKQMEDDITTVVARYSTVSLSNDPTFNNDFEYTITNTYNTTTQLYDYVVRSNRPGIMPSKICFNTVRDQQGRELNNIPKDYNVVVPYDLNPANEYDVEPIREVSYYVTVVTLDYCNFSNVTDISYILPGAELLHNGDIHPQFWDINKVTNMRGAFGCDHSDIKNAIICGPNVKDMSSAYYWCSCLEGNPVCGPNVTEMKSTYYYCNYITGSPACGNNVVNMNSAYYSCRNLTGSPVIGPNVVNMPSVYYNCYNLTGSPVCGDKVLYMNNAYYNCSNLTGSPVCGNNVISMYNTYAYCSNLTGSPVIGPNVTNISGAYYNCQNLTGSPVIGPNITDMSKTYSYCVNLTGEPVYSNEVTNMSYAFIGCSNLNGTAIMGSSVTDISYAFSNCPNITVGNTYIYSNMVNIARSCFNNKNTGRLNVYVPKNSQTMNTCLFDNSYSLVGNNITWTQSGSYYYNTGYNVYLYGVDDVPATKELNENPNIIMRYTTTDNTMKPVTVSGVSSYTTSVSGNSVTLLNTGSTNAVYINFYGRQSLTGIVAMTSTINDLRHSFQNCRNLTGQPWCGDAVTNLYYAYENCYNLTGSPLCSDNVVNMRYAYTNCYNLTGSPACGLKVNDFMYAYDNCRSLTGEPVCGPNVKSMTDVYRECHNLTGTAVCGNNVTDMASTYYNCQNLTSAIVGPNVTNLTQTYVNCHNIVKTIVYSNKVVNAWNIFNRRSNAKRLNIFVPKTGNTLNTFLYTNNASIVGKSITWTNNSGTCYYNTRDNIYIYPLTSVNSTYTVSTVSGATYGFPYNSSSGYYVSNCKTDGGYSICNVSIQNPLGQNVIVDYNQSSEYSYDFGLISNINTTLVLSNRIDSTNVFANLCGVSGSNTVDLGAVNGFVYIKYRKDGSGSSGNDELKFKIIFK